MTDPDKLFNAVCGCLSPVLAVAVMAGCVWMLVLALVQWTQLVFPGCKA